jgi:hypothetical protein
MQFTYALVNQKLTFISFDHSYIIFASNYVVLG